MSKPLIDYYNEKVEFNRLPDCAEKVQLAVTRLENPYNISEEDRLMYQDYLGKDAVKAVPELIDKNAIRMFPLLVKYRTIKKGNVAKMVEYAQSARKMDILSYLLNAGNDLRFHPKNLDIAPKFTPGKSDNNVPQQIPDYESLRVGDIVFSKHYNDKDNSMFNSNICFRNIAHCSMVYSISNNGEIALMECVGEGTAPVGEVIILTSLGYNGSYDKTRSTFLTHNVVMCARLPYAFGYPTNVPESF